MGLYERYIFPRLMDWALRDKDVATLRAELLAEARGHVLEIGFGTGLNLRYYPRGIERLTAVDPNPGVKKLAARRAVAAPFEVEHTIGTAESLPLPAASVDTAVSTFTLCSVREPAQALAEIRRVLRPGGRLLVIEHGLSRDAKVARWQRRLTPAQRWLGCGCHLDRDVRRMVESSGFQFEHAHSDYLPRGLRIGTYVTRGSARVV